MSFFASVGKQKPVIGVKIKKVKGALEHIGLYLGLALYTAVGAKVGYGIQEVENYLKIYASRQKKK